MIVFKIFGGRGTVEVRGMIVFQVFAGKAGQFAGFDTVTLQVRSVG